MGWDRDQALPVALELKELLGPACHILEVAGSLRRGLPEVGDVELVAVPKQWGNDALGYSLLDPEMDDLLARGVIEFRLDSRGRKTYGERNRFLVHQPSGVPVDFFIGDRTNFGMLFVVRTGSAGFNVALMSQLKRMGHRGHAYGGITLYADDPQRRRDIEVPDEETVFNLLGIDFIPPSQRDENALRRVQ